MSIGHCPRNSTGRPEILVAIFLRMDIDPFTTNDIMKHLLLCTFILLATTTYAQRNMQEVDFVVDGEKLSMPFAGGFNALIIAAEDLNNDGKKDLLLFDKSDNSFIGFRNEGGPGEINYIPDESLVQHFPDANNWAYLIDYDFDGAADLFTISPVGGAGIALYKGRWEGNRLAFDFKSNRLETIDQHQLYTSSNKLPAIDDINGDGDIDILVFDLNDRLIQYYENQSKEQGSPMDTLILKRKSNCWGYICECSSVDNSLELDYQGSGCFHNLWGGGFPGNGDAPRHKTRHAGSTLMTFDPDDDGDKDVLLGDAGFSNLVYLENSPGAFDSISTYDMNFPAYDVPVAYNKFPAPYYVDIDNDGKKDILISTYSPPVCGLHLLLDTAYNKNLLFYKNTGTGGKDTFRYQSNNLLVKDMIDVGFNSRPAYFDYNGDGLEDIVVGRCYMRDANDKDSIYFGLVLFENKGTASAPNYELVSEDYASLRQYGYMGISPEFADLDGDGDNDMIIALRGGDMHYFRNDAGAGNEASFTRVEGFFDALTSVSSPAPQVVDVDGDGLLDLLVGEKQGRVNYYKNYGTQSEPDFQQESNFWGEVDVRQGSYYGYAVPWLGDADGDGERELLVANQNGYVLKYTNVDGNLGGEFDLVDTNYLQMTWGQYLTLDLADIDGNGEYDFLLGNYRGGLRLRTFGQPVGIKPSQQRALAFEVYPNPAVQVLTVRTSAPAEGVIKLINLTGTTLIRQEHHSPSTTLDIEHLPNGIYIVAFNNGESTAMKKVVVKR